MAHQQVRSIKELAREFGTTSQRLVALMANDVNAPKPVLMPGRRATQSALNGGLQHTRTFKVGQYNYAEAKAWWENRLEDNK